MNFVTEHFFELLIAWIILAIVVFFFLSYKTTAEYGKFYKEGSKLQIENRLGWILMELPTLILMPLYFIFGKNDLNFATIVILSLYLIHYINRVVIFPFRIKTDGKKIPIDIVVSAIVFNVINTFFLGYYYGFIHQLENQILSSPLFIIGVILFFMGMYVNISSDNKLISLRSDSNLDGYAIPKGGLFKYVSCPNYLGELMEWLAYSILCFNLSSLSFAIWTFANLAPRARANHRWYKAKFKNYPSKRKAIIPFLY